MPNIHSKAGHKATRTCVICRSKAEQSSLLNFYLLDGELVFDINKAVNTRKKYVCQNEACLKLLDKWLARQRKKASAA